MSQIKKTRLFKQLNLIHNMDNGSITSLEWLSRFLDETPGDEVIGGIPRQVPGACWSRVAPTVVPNPTLRLWSIEMAKELGINAGGEEFLSGNKTTNGMDPYAAVVPTLGDSSAHGMHMSTFMVTAHTEDVSFWLDSEPMSGYSIDNLHPSVPMGLAFSTSPGSVSLNWSGPVEEDFSYFNIYRQDILTNEPAVVFTTTDSFYVDQELSDVGAYEYWVTAVDMSGLESDASSIVSAVLSAEEKMGMHVLRYQPHQQVEDSLLTTGF